MSLFDAADHRDWMNYNPNKCGCRGSGWFLSDVDTFHPCVYHNLGAPNPENESSFDWTSGKGFDWEAHQLEVYRTAYRFFLRLARRNGWKGKAHDFARCCRRFLTTPLNPTPSDWVNAAEKLTCR